jgi:endonuclease/exonuclease/phosphatase family metal-dependent hydrolase
MSVALLFAVRISTPAAATKCSEPAIHSGSVSTEKQLSSTGLQVVSLNMAREERLDRILRDLTEAQDLAGADVWLLQEAVERPASTRTIADLANSLNLNYVFAPVDVFDGGNLLSGLAILSRYPIREPRIIPLRRHNLKFNTRCRIALEAQISGPFGPVRFYNVHLDTRITGRQRIDQITPVLEQASSLNGPGVVAGDFNTADVRWLWNILPIPFAENHRDRIRHAFRDRGFDSPLDGNRPTIDVLNLPLRLDWIFPRGLNPVSAGVTTIKFSDHNAVWVRLDLTDVQD